VAAEVVSSEPNQPISKTRLARSDKGTLAGVLPFEITFARLSWAIRLVNTLLVLAAVLYCLAILFGLKISLLGRLGGISHVSRAFFLSLIVVVLLLPWQKVFGKLVTGMIYTPAELADWAGADKSDILDKVLYYLRFTGYWVLVLLLVILCQIRSSRWTKAILRRLEVI
jgi:flagellar biosynthesis protein FliQ